MNGSNLPYLATSQATGTAFQPHFTVVVIPWVHFSLPVASAQSIAAAEGLLNASRLGNGSDQSKGSLQQGQNGGKGLIRI